MSLPTDWWQYRASAEVLSGLFRRHLLGLLLSFKMQDKTHHEFYTGFLLDFKETLLAFGARDRGFFEAFSCGAPRRQLIRKPLGWR